MDVRKERYMLISSGSDRVKKFRLKLMKNLKYFLEIYNGTVLFHRS